VCKFYFPFFSNFCIYCKCNNDDVNELVKKKKMEGELRHNSFSTGSFGVVPEHFGSVKSLFPWWELNPGLFGYNQ